MLATPMTAVYCVSGIDHVQELFCCKFRSDGVSSDSEEVRIILTTPLSPTHKQNMGWRRSVRQSGALWATSVVNRGIRGGSVRTSPVRRKYLGEDERARRRLQRTARSSDRLLPYDEIHASRYGTWQPRAVTAYRMSASYYPRTEILNRFHDPMLIGRDGHKVHCVSKKYTFDVW